jgi:hypothetical protein
MEVKQY